MSLRYLSVCSGIEAATVAWHPLGWEPVAFAEIDAFPSAVLAHHYPSVPNLGDFTAIRGDELGAVDLLVGGTPCQDFSVAGLRAGLDGERGQLTLEFLRLLGRLRTRWVVWENVPGVLSQDGGRAFGAFLGGLAELGYGWAYRVLDAQYAGVPQRRRRVFVVGCIGDERRAAAVLFERASVSGHPAPRREAGQVAPTIPARRSAGGGLGTDFDCDGGLIAGTIRASGSVLARVGNGETELLVAHALRAEGFDASEDGTGRGTPLVPVAFTQNSRSELRLIGGDGQTTGAVTAEPGAQCQNYVAFAWQGGGTQTTLGYDPDSSSSPTLSANQTPAIAFSCKDHGADAGELSPTLRAMEHSGSHANAGGQVAVAFTTGIEPHVAEDGTAYTLLQPSASGGGQPQAVAVRSAVRRLTPVECERLQGFPDFYTLVPYRGKPAADGPRYRALGNSFAVPVVRWIGERIALVESIASEAEGAA